MAMALLPIFVLSLIQTQADFREQRVQRQVDLQLAAERSATNAKSRLDSAQVPPPQSCRAAELRRSAAARMELMASPAARPSRP